MNWAVGVTTAPRREPTLDQCLLSVRDAGWEQYRIFAEPGACQQYMDNGTSFSNRDSTLGVWPNWFLGLHELFLRQPHADAYMIVQDDAVFCRNVRQLLERLDWNSGDIGVVSPYCPTVYNEDLVGLHDIAANWTLIGALTYIFPADSIESILTFPDAVTYRRDDPNGGLKHVDSVVGRWCQSTGKRACYFSPSLVQHIGRTSTIDESEHVTGIRVASCFVGRDFDANLLEAGIMFRKVIPKTVEIAQPSVREFNGLKRLEIGPGNNPLLDFETLDVRGNPTYHLRWGYDRLGDVIPPCSFDEIYASHVLEHIIWNAIDGALEDAFTILKPGGMIEIWVPDFQYIVGCYENRECGDSWRRDNPNSDPMVWINGRIFTYGPDDHNIHRSCFDYEHLSNCLSRAGFVDIRRCSQRLRGTSHGKIDLGVTAVRPNQQTD